jgi:hypothetical protein
MLQPIYPQMSQIPQMERAQSRIMPVPPTQRRVFQRSHHLRHLRHLRIKTPFLV